MSCGYAKLLLQVRAAAGWAFGLVLLGPYEKFKLVVTLVAFVFVDGHASLRQPLIVDLGRAITLESPYVALPILASSFHQAQGSAGKLWGSVIGFRLHSTDDSVR